MSREADALAATGARSKREVVVLVTWALFCDFGL